MKGLLNSNIFKVIQIIIILIGNIVFYTWGGYQNSGAMAAAIDVHLLFYFMCQGLLAGALYGLIKLTIKGW